VSYDLVDLGGGSKPISSAAAPTFAVPSSAPQPQATAVVAASSSSSVRFEAQISSSITANNTFTVCNSLTAGSNPWVLGSASVNQSLSFLGNSQCTLTPSLLAPNSSAGCASLVVSGGSWLSLQNVITPSLPGCVGLLTMNPNSYLEVVIPTTLSPNAYAVQNFPLLVTQGVCPSLVSVNPSIVNCPVDTTTALTGPYTCALTTTAANSMCILGLNIAGCLVAQATTNIQVVMNKDCSTMTQTTFKAIITSVIGVSPAAIMITYWQCSSIVVIFTVLGATSAQATSVLNLIYASMLGGPLRSLLAVTSVAFNPAPFPTAVTVTSTYARPYYPMIPYPIVVSSSNPALFALLSLLVIPVAVVIPLLVWWCYRNRVVPVPEPACIPQCCPQPMPCPMPCPMPTCCPAPEPMCGTTMMDPLYTPSSTPFVTPGSYGPVC
jgi:hypothetical protein